MKIIATSLVGTWVKKWPAVKGLKKYLTFSLMLMTHILCSSKNWKFLEGRGRGILKAKFEEQSMKLNWNYLGDGVGRGGGGAEQKAFCVGS